LINSFTARGSDMQTKGLTGLHRTTSTTTDIRVLPNDEDRILVPFKNLK